MNFEFKNLGTIEYANLELNGITVLTGLNNTGKSFLGKAIYSIIKTVGEANRSAEINKYQSANNLLTTINSIHRSVVELSGERANKFHIAPIQSSLFDYFVSQPVNKPYPNEVIDLVHDYYLRVRSDLDHHRRTIGADSKRTISPKAIDDAIDKLTYTYRPLQEIVTEPIHDESTFREYFNSTFVQKLFQSQLNAYANEKPVEITVKEGLTELLQIRVENNKTTRFQVSNQSFLRDAIVIDTPTIVQITDFITNALAFSPQTEQRNDLPHYYIDLAMKLRVARTISSRASYIDITNKIKSIISGEFVVSNEESGIIYLKDGKPIRPFDIATGVKSFGILQLLLNSVFIRERSLLIIDEPEVHLHPKWEVEYAKVILALSKAGIIILISTHSAYFVRALRKFSFEQDLPTDTKFYFGEKLETGKQTVFKDVTENLEPIFRALAQPMIDIS